ncbi:hypothetical protein O181_054404 [Austropuccinia psidii MF-1]|uniref:Uncharacterized protein n=1 Tax=Austropuccinia psidii MF-1 TaxID=1389203 RepID=A0A9Q3HTM9_9BASI|nr:hypothetical protein [Austropuccinia psidii MF-1]
MAEANQLQKDKGHLMTSNSINYVILKPIILCLPSNRADTTTRSLSVHIQSQPERLQQCIAAHRVPDPLRSVEKLHEFLPDCEKLPGPSRRLQVAQWMAFIDGKEEYCSLSSRMEGKQLSTTQESAKTAPVGRSSNYNVKKQTQAQNKGKGKAPARATESQTFSRIAWKMYFRWPEK